MSQLPYRPYCLKYGSIEFMGLVSHDLYLECEELRQKFHKSLTEFVLEDGPSSSAELYGKFLGFIAPFVNQYQPGRFDEFVKETLLHFQMQFLEGTDIHTFVDSLLVLEKDPRTRLIVKENFIKGYYTAIVNCNMRIERIHESHAQVNAVFSGQGNPLYFALLLEYYRLYRVFIYTDFLVPMGAKLNELVLGEGSFAPLYPQGLDILNWLQNPAQIPDQEYLWSAPVSCPLITLTQLTFFIVQSLTTGSTPGEYRKGFIGMAGRSQGIVAAMAISLFDSWDSFLENAVKAVSLMFFVGARTSLIHSAAPIPLAMTHDSIEYKEGCPSSMLMIRGLDLKQAEVFIELANKDLFEDERLAISIFNSPANFGIAGSPKYLYALAIILRNARAGNSSQQEPKSKTRNKLRLLFKKETNPQNFVPLNFSYGFLPVHARFNSYHLAGSYNLIFQDIIKAGIEFSSKDMEIPVYDCHNGSNLQDYDISSQECSLTCRLVKLIIELPVHWGEVTKIIGTNYMELGPRDIFNAVD